MILSVMRHPIKLDLCLIGTLRSAPQIRIYRDANGGLQAIAAHRSEISGRNESILERTHSACYNTVPGEG